MNSLASIKATEDEKSAIKVGGLSNELLNAYQAEKGEKGNDVNMEFASDIFELSILLQIGEYKKNFYASVYSYCDGDMTLMGDVIKLIKLKQNNQELSINTLLEYAKTSRGKNYAEKKEINEKKADVALKNLIPLYSNNSNVSNGVSGTDSTSGTKDSTRGSDSIGPPKK
ncbi:MAG: hypothetical protein H6607_05470 [Flavobacteriales bacterium]|nr:hypothetical protein [Flavobacteriales bacterium]